MHSATGGLWVDDAEPDLMAALVELQQTAQAQGVRVLSLIPEDDMGNVTPYFADGRGGAASWL
jgi:hypothetical protein